MLSPQRNAQVRILPGALRSRPGPGAIPPAQARPGRRRELRATLGNGSGGEQLRCNVRCGCMCAGRRSRVTAAPLVLAMWHGLADDQQTRRNASPVRSRAAAPRPRPDRPGLRAAAGRRGARPRRAHVGRAPQPRVPARLWRVAVRLPHDAAHRARDGAPASWRPQRDLGLFRGRLLVAGHLQHPVHRAGRHAAEHLPAPRGAGSGRDPVVRGETGEQTDQESRSTGRRAAPSVTAMDLTIHTTVLPHLDPASLAFYRDTLSFEVRTDAGQGTMRWITVGPADQPGTSILLAPPAVDPGITDDERRTIVEMMAKGTYGWILLASKDLDGTFERLQAGDAEVVQEPTEQPYGVRDCAFRDPAGNLIRIQELR